MDNEIDPKIELRSELIDRTVQLAVGNLRAQESLLIELSKLSKQVACDVVPGPLLRELLVLQNDTGLGVKEMVCQAIRMYIDSVKSDDRHIWFDGVKYPLPELHRVP